jgi:putative FmdB family regulatory protein
MATYYYKCNTCEASASVSNPISEESKVPKCLECNKNMERVFSAPAVTFKGSGWGSDR